MPHEMPQSLLVFAVSLTAETPNLGRFGGVPLEDFLIFCFFKWVYAHK